MDDAISQLLEQLFKAADEADDALDKDTYEQYRRAEFDPHVDDEIWVRAGTAIKCDLVFNLVDNIKRTLAKATQADDATKERTQREVNQS